jgi:Protein of unknown function (DUF4232)
MAAVAAFVGTAVLAVALTRAPARDGVSLSSDVSARVCAPFGLQAWLGLGTAATGATGSAGETGSRPVEGTYYTLEFTNVSARACSLFGYPEVSAYVDSPKARIAIGLAAARDTSVQPHPVMLAPGATAHAGLRVTVQPAQCEQVTAEELRVALPRQDRPAIVPVHIPLCSQKGQVSLSVQAIQARPGVPGYPLRP